MRVLVLDGNENQAVACVRSLSRAGHEVWVGADTAWSKAGWSRHAYRSFRYPGPDHDAAGFVDTICRVASTTPRTLVLPMTERATICLSAARERLDEVQAVYVFPPHEVLLRAMDKGETTSLARSLGIAVPNTWVARDRNEAVSISRLARFPVVLKAASSEEMTTSGTTRTTGAPMYARATDFLRAYDEMRLRSSAVVIQEFIRGEGKGYFALMSHGELRAEFAHRRLRDVRPSGSGSALRESIAIDPGLRQSGLAILRALEWHGVAMVEFRDPGDGRPVFLEINGRFWNSLALAIHAGTDFPALLADMAVGGSGRSRAPHRPGVRCRWMLGDLQHLFAVFKGPPVGFPEAYPSPVRAVAHLLRPVRGTFHDNFVIDDPLPELGDWLHFFGRRLPREWRKRRSLGTLAERAASPVTEIQRGEGLSDQ